MSDTARAFWIAEPGRGEIRTERLPSPASGDAVVRALYSGISRGTEALVFKGRVPPSEWDRMRAPFQEGDFPAPVKYGYASVGYVEQGRPDLLDRTVFVLYPHQTRYVVPSASLHVLPEGTPPARAVLAANMETALNGLWDAQVQAGDRVAVVGAGTVGSLVAWLVSKIPGCDVQLVDVNASRAQVASGLGVPFADAAVARGEADVVIHASGSPAGLARALELAAFEGRILELSWFGDQVVPLTLGGAFHSRRLSIVSSQVGTVARPQRSRWDTRRRMQLALALLSEPALDVLITGESDFEELPDVMARLASAPGGTLCHRVKYQDAGAPAPAHSKS
jgi:2-desacetyl-2-hydroxyethyl bacteriochlorophyllide A dehydrogenase